jgi:hypothetical protein
MKTYHIRSWDLRLWVPLCLVAGLSLAQIVPIRQVVPDQPVLPPVGFEEDIQPLHVSHGACTVDPTVAKSGTASLRIVGSGAVETDFLDLNGAAWKLSVWMKTDRVVRGKQPYHVADVQVCLFDADKKPRRGSRMNHWELGHTTGTTDWTLHEGGIFLAPRYGVRYVKIRLENWSIASGTTWFDDLRLTTAAVPESYRALPPLHVVENQMPRVWPLPPVKPLAQVRPLPGSELPLHVPDVRLLVGGREPAVPSVQGCDIDRGYMTRLVERRTPGPGPDGLAAERYCEFFRGSPITYWFPRAWLPERTQVSGAKLRVSLSAKPARVRTFDGNRLVEVAPGTPFTLGPKTTKPFVIVSNADDTAGTILFHPLPPEIRRWHVEDYVVERELAATVTVGASVVYDLGGFETGPGGACHSLDFHVFALPFTGSYEAALRAFQLRKTALTANALPLSANEKRGFWTRRMSRATGARLCQMSRYFPREFSSHMNSSGWDYGHADGFGWGNMTASMKGIRVGPTSATPFKRDHAWRMLTFFVEASDVEGSPRQMYTWRSRTAKAPKEQHYAFVFCQYWEYRLAEFRRWLTDPDLLKPAEKERIYQELQRARHVYDPAFTETTWTYRTPNGGYWFEYHNVPRGQRRWVINTHVTSCGNVGEFARIARDLGKDEDARIWTDIFKRGIDGLLWVLSQRDMWTEWDENEVRYAKAGGGPRGYHRYMVSAWLRETVALDMDIAGDYRLAELVTFWKRLASASYTDERSRKGMQPTLAEAEKRLQR